jgi:hypothetical protein
MVVEHRPASSELIEVLDRVLDKGIVIDAAIRISLVGLNLIDLDVRIVVASIETYAKYAKPCMFAKVAGVRLQLDQPVKRTEIRRGAGLRLNGGPRVAGQAPHKAFLNSARPRKGRHG